MAPGGGDLENNTVNKKVGVDDSYMMTRLLGLVFLSRIDYIL